MLGCCHSFLSQFLWLNHCQCKFVVGKSQKLCAILNACVLNSGSICITCCDYSSVHSSVNFIPTVNTCASLEETAAYEISPVLLWLCILFIVQQCVCHSYAVNQIVHRVTQFCSKMWCPPLHQIHSNLGRSCLCNNCNQNWYQVGHYVCKCDSVMMWHTTKSSSLGLRA